MLAICFFICYLAGGAWIVRRLLPDRSPLLRLWLGGSLGVLLFMWLPACIAFITRLDLTAQWLALLLLALLCIAATRCGRECPKKCWDARETRALRAILYVVVPFTLLSFFLQCTHTLRAVDGALHVGQSTYGDLCLHLSIATSLQGAHFPPDYALLPGTRLAYPFLTDTLSTSLLLLGLPLRWAFIVPGTVMMMLVYTGVLLLAREMTGRCREAVVVLLLLLCCGGLGFLYSWDMVGKDPSRFLSIFTGYYQTPANQPAFNLRWSNLLADMLLPQRTFLGGWTVLLPALYLLREALRTRSPRFFLLLGVWAGTMPLIHTHSFLALGLASGGMILYALCTRHPDDVLAPDATRRDRRWLAQMAGLYLALTLLLALPQLLAFTFRQSASEGFLLLQFNWVNNPKGQGLIDTYFYFWVKNAGLPILLLLAALLDMTPQQRQDVSGAFAIFFVAECVLFQPNEYDNNKLFYVWFLLVLPIAVQYGARVWERLRGLRSRVLLAALFLTFSMMSGALSIARETISDYQLFSADDVAVASFVTQNTPRDAVFLTGTQHNNPISALAGRKIVCGPSLYLHYHGLNFAAPERAVNAFYDHPLQHLDVLQTYNVSYILLSINESAKWGTDPALLDATFPCVFAQGDVRLYAVH